MTIEDDALRADIRRLGNQLGDTLVRQHGSELLELVEKVRSLEKEARREGRTEAASELRSILPGLSIDEVIPLVRAFTTYFYPANVTEQVHRIDQLAPDDRYLRPTVDRFAAAGLDKSLIEDVLARFEVRPAFAAHATKVARRSRHSVPVRASTLGLSRPHVQPESHPDHPAVSRHTSASAGSSRC